MTRRILFAALAFVAALSAADYSHGLRAQSLSLPTYTSAQAAQGQQAYEKACSACHGANLDDGEFAPALKGGDFRLRWGGKPVEGLFNQMAQTMPPGSPGSLGDETYAQVLAYVIQENGVIAGTRQLPADPTLLRTAMLPSAAGGPGGGLTLGVSIPPPPSKPNPLDRLTPVTDAMLQNPPAGEWLTWRRAYDAQGFSPLKQITQANVGDLRLGVELGAAQRTERSDAARSRRRDVRPRVRRQSAGARRGNRRSAVAVLAAAAARAQSQREASDRAVWRTTCTCRRPTRTSSRSTRRPATSCGIRRWPTTKGGYGMTGGPLVANGKVMVGTTGRAARRQLHRRARCGDREGSVAVLRRSRGPASRAATPGTVCRSRNATAPRCGCLAATIGRSTSRSSGRRRPTTPGRFAISPTKATSPTTRSTRTRRSPSIPTPASWCGTSSISRTISGISTGRSSGMCCQLRVNGVEQTLVVHRRQAGDLRRRWRRDTGTYAFSIDLGVQNVVTAIDPKTGAKTIDPRPRARRRPDQVRLSARGRREVVAAFVVQPATPRCCTCRSSSRAWTSRRWRPAGAAACRPACAGRCGRVRTATANTAALQAINLETRQDGLDRASARAADDRRRWPRPAASCSRARSIGCLRPTTTRLARSCGARASATCRAIAPISYTVERQAVRGDGRR